MRILAAVQLLADGATVDAVARAVGYRSTFRRATGRVIRPPQVREVARPEPPPAYK